MNSFKKVFNNVLNIVITILVFGVVTIFLFMLVTSNSSAILGIRNFNVLTGSMEPKIPVGSLVFTMDAANYNIGDVIAFKRGDITVTHRIVGIKDGLFETKGDANNSVDPQMVTKSNIIGKEFFVLPLFGKVVTFIKTVPGFLLLIVVPTIIFIFLEARVMKAEWEKEIEKKVIKKLKETEGAWEQN